MSKETQVLWFFKLKSKPKCNAIFVDSVNNLYSRPELFCKKRCS